MGLPGCSVVFLCLLLLKAVGTLAEDDVREPVACTMPRKAQVDLSYRHLAQVPPTLPRDAQYLDLSYNNISQLRRADLDALTDLCVLKITHNGLRVISPAAFQQNRKLQVLNISFNALTTVPDLTVPSLLIVDVSENLYESYRLGQTFESLQNLFFLALGSPRADTITSSDFIPLNRTPLRKLQLGSGAEMEIYENGSFSELLQLREVTLKMTFCQRPELFRAMLRDLDSTKTMSVKLVKFLPDICNVSATLSDGLRDLRHLRNLTFQSTWFNSSVLSVLARNIIQSPIQDLSFLNITYAQDTSDGINIQTIPGFNRTANVKAITFDTIHHYQYNFPFISINKTLFSKMTYLRFSGTGMSIVPCDVISSSPSLEVLDLSNNLLRDRGLWWSSCSFTDKFPALKGLYLRNNKFEDLQFIADHVHNMTALDSLDLSTNAIKLTGQSFWPAHLTSLSLSDNSLGDKVFHHLSPHIRTLNLSKTGITDLTQAALSQLTSLRQLFLSSNVIKTLPQDLFAPKLEELHVDMNAIISLNPQMFEGLPGLKKLRAGHNPFACNCDLYWFVTTFNKTLLLDWPYDYTCFSPPNLAGVLLSQYQPSRVHCDPWIQVAISLVITLTATAALGVVFYACDGAWYLKMLWVWLRVKRRGYQQKNRMGQEAFSYHAFISYSQQDSMWVETQLVPTLEGAGLALCVHKRDFVPGEWILNNIINCVEGSYKTLFVLSQNFIQSEWCNYELFFAQHRALSVHQDSLVFVLLEPIPADSIPRKYLKLRNLLRLQTYLEWPEEECKRQVFWASLKAMLRTGGGNVVLRDVAQEIAHLCDPLEGNEPLIQKAEE
ncbi:hypothetical protein JZ751_028869 [Albula glossodonta]|uniref:TIR domain-containing protein n=1 Tax=Albula glossodonta TaxID=121402 RepID=A0A8T2NEI2_9TELE|nr:hypothetical protein JZ751_008176 [Albula glossodonta]KAG9337301.1 hypothetical protein JZ751_028869 [Albula glossodonta]